MSVSPNDHVRPVVALSKSKFLSGLQCHKRLYLEVTHPELGEPPDTSTQALLAMGTEIGVLAQRRFPGGVLVPPSGYLREVEQICRDHGVLTIADVVIGGFGSVPGAMVGGLVLGVLEVLIAAFVSSAFKDAIAFAILILFLVAMPRGIFGERIAEKV